MHENIRKRLEDSPSYSSFGDKGQEHGKILYNEVSAVLCDTTCSALIVSHIV